MEDRIYEVLGNISRKTKNKKLKGVIGYIKSMMVEVSSMDYNDWLDFLDYEYDEFENESINGLEKIINGG